MKHKHKWILLGKVKHPHYTDCVGLDALEFACVCGKLKYVDVIQEVRE